MTNYFFSQVLYLPSTNILIQETGDWAVGGWEEGLLLEHQERSQLDLHRIKISKTILGGPLHTPNTHSTILKDDTSDFETTTNTGHNSERVMLNQNPVKNLNNRDNICKQGERDIFPALLEIIFVIIVFNDATILTCCAFCINAINPIHTWNNFPFFSCTSSDSCT